MKANTKKLLNDQIKIILKELEQVEDVKDRVELRIEAIEAIYKISCHDSEEIVPQGKDSIREDIPKDICTPPEPIYMDEDEEEDNEIVVEEPEEEEEVEEPQEVTMDEVIDAGAKLDPEVAAQQAMNLEQEEITEEESNEPVVVNGVDVTEAFNEINSEISVDFRKELAAQIMEYGTLNTFKTLNFINEVDDEVVSYKNLLAYYIDTWGMETVEYYINYFGDNIEQDENGEELYAGEELHVDFLNENNIKGFCDYIEAIVAEEE